MDFWGWGRGRRRTYLTGGGCFAGQYLDLGLKLCDPFACIFGDGGVGVRQVGSAVVTCLRGRGDGKWRGL